MFKNVVSLRLKPAVTTAHSHTAGVDAVRTDDDDTIINVVDVPSHARISAYISSLAVYNGSISRYCRPVYA